MEEELKTEMIEKIVKNLIFLSKEERKSAGDSTPYLATEYLGKMGMLLLKGIPEEQIQDLIPSKYKIDDTEEKSDKEKIEEKTKAEAETKTEATSEEE